MRARIPFGNALAPHRYCKNFDVLVRETAFEIILSISYE